MPSNDFTENRDTSCQWFRYCITQFRGQGWQDGILFLCAIQPWWNTSEHSVLHLSHLVPPCILYYLSYKASASYFCVPAYVVWWIISYPFSFLGHWWLLYFCRAKLLRILMLRSLKRKIWLLKLEGAWRLEDSWIKLSPSPLWFCGQ